VICARTTHTVAQDQINAILEAASEGTVTGNNTDKTPDWLDLLEANTTSVVRMWELTTPVPTVDAVAAEEKAALGFEVRVCE
jgi:hypothetical protein